MKKVILLAIVILISNITFGQDNFTNNEAVETEGLSKSISKTNAEYALELINRPTVKVVIIFLRGFNKTYRKEVIRTKIEGEFLIISYYSKGDISKEVTHRWKLKDLIFVEEYNDIIKIRLDAHAGE